MKILHIIPTADPAYGGPVEGVRQYGAKALEMGHSIEILSLDSPDEPFLAGHPLKVHAIGPSIGRYRYNRSLAPWLTENCSRYDAVVINGLWMYHAFGSWRALKKLNKPYFVFTHGMLDPWFKRNYRLKHLKKLLYWPWADYRVLRDATKVLFTCEQERILARESFSLYAANEAVVNYGAGAPSSGDPEVQSAAFLSNYPEVRGKKLVLFLSRVHEKKGCDILIKAFSQVARTRTEWHLVIAGPGDESYISKLKQLAESEGISDRTTWTGLLRDDLKWGAFASSDVFCLPSHQENFGIAVAESLACGLPVIISNQVNIWREIVKDGAGIARPDTVEATADALTAWMSTPNGEKDAMRINARRCFTTRFTSAAMAESITGTIQGALNSSLQSGRLK